MLRKLTAMLATALLLCAMAGPASAADNSNETYSKNEVKDAIDGFFEGTAKGLADLIEKAFEDNGRPVGYIKGGEGGGALFVGLRYGEGTLFLKRNAARRKVYWQGPSLGLDIGANVAKVFTLVYKMRNPDDIYQRFPGVDGSAYIVGGFSMNYQKSGDIVLAPIRTGAGLRLGANVGYLHYTKSKSINPF